MTTICFSRDNQPVTIQHLNKNNEILEIRQIPKAKEKWQHYKKEHPYTIIGVAWFGVDLWVIYAKTFCDLPLIAKNTDREKEEYYYVDKFGNNIIASAASIMDTTKEVWEINKVWARPLEEFMEVLSNKAGDHANNWYRFTKIMNTSPDRELESSVFLTGEMPPGEIAKRIMTQLEKQTTNKLTDKELEDLFVKFSALAKESKHPKEKVAFFQIRSALRSLGVIRGLTTVL